MQFLSQLPFQFFTVLKYKSSYFQSREFSSNKLGRQNLCKSEFSSWHSEKQLKNNILTLWKLTRTGIFSVGFIFYHLNTFSHVECFPMSCGCVACSLHRRRLHYQRNCIGLIANFHCWPGISRTLKNILHSQLVFHWSLKQFLPYCSIFPAAQFSVRQLYKGAQHCNSRERVDLTSFPALMRGYNCILESKSCWTPVVGKVITQCLAYWSSQAQIQHTFLGGAGSGFSFILKALKE